MGARCSATRLPDCFLQRARDVLEDLFFPPSIIALRSARTNPVVDGHIAAVELNDARFDDDIVTAINQSRSCIWLAHRALSRLPRLPLSLPSKRTRYGHSTSHRVSGQEQIQPGRQWCPRCVGCWSAKEVVLNALRLGKAAVKHPSQLHDLMEWGGESEAPSCRGCSMSERGETL